MLLIKEKLDLGQSQMDNLEKLDDLEEEIHDLENNKSYVELKERRFFLLSEKKSILSYFGKGKIKKDQRSCSIFFKS